MTSDRSTKRWGVLCVRLLLLVSGLAVLTLVLWRVTAPHGWICSPVRFDEPRMDDAVHWIRSQRVSGQGPIVVLPARLASVSITGRAYITNDLVFIPTWIGDRWRYDPDRTDVSWLEGFVYSEKPVKIDLHVPFGILNVPASCRPEDAKKNALGDDREMFFGAAVDRGKHWYPVDSFS